jgi:hypothetical protein
MAKIVTTELDVIRGITTFNAELEANEGLKERVAYARGWYAVRNGDDSGWSFGPSKFIGYKDLTADDYLASDNGLDGRKTEAQLAQWFQIVDDGTELHDELWNALVEFLEGYGKEPSRAARISILDSSRDGSIDKNDHYSKVVELIIEVARLLPAPQLRALKDKLAA